MSAISPFRTFVGRRLKTDIDKSRFYRRVANRIHTMTQLRRVIDTAPDPKAMLDGLKPFLRIRE